MSAWRKCDCSRKNKPELISSAVAPDQQRWAQPTRAESQALGEPSLPAGSQTPQLPALLEKREGKTIEVKLAQILLSSECFPKPC